ncbi:hypothetical protein RGQ29_018877 [Quercus rubra]|uniref:Uncharacterized protein n=1 Tax=Quercus rubra TaxID=3512 RepID=A0AAN7F7U0_QUERU|nr:hypothetical protein RGQ29_018877 [Quercus rubra]
MPAERMLIHSPYPAIFHRTSTYLGSVKCNINNSTLSIINKNTTSSSISIIKNTTTGLIGACSSCRVGLTGFLVAAVVISSVAGGVRAIEAPQESETLSNIPQTLSGECALPKDCKKARIQRPKSRKAESCTIKCVTTCIRGGEGSPGEGPFNVRRPLVVFKQGFRSRQYCLVECSDICNLIGDGDDGP